MNMRRWKVNEDSIYVLIISNFGSKITITRFGYPSKSSFKFGLYSEPQDWISQRSFVFDVNKRIKTIHVLDKPTNFTLRLPDQKVLFNQHPRIINFLPDGLYLPELKK